MEEMSVFNTGKKVNEPPMDSDIFKSASGYLSTDGLEESYKIKVKEELEHILIIVPENPEYIKLYRVIPKMFHEDIIKANYQTVFYLNDMYASPLMKAIVLMQEAHASAEEKTRMLELVKEAKNDYGFRDALGNNWESRFIKDDGALTIKAYGHP